MAVPASSEKHAEAFVVRDALADEMPTVATLFREYADALDLDLSYQDFAAELAGLPGRYRPPLGALLLAVASTGEPVGCVAVRPLTEPGTCEMKRLHTRASARGAGVGRALAEAAIAAGRSAGYQSMRLDTLPTMVAAQVLYRRLGFDVTPPYYSSPVAGTIFMRKMLSPS